MPPLTTKPEEIATHMHADCMGTALQAGDVVSIFGGPLLRVERLHGSGLFVFLDANGEERTQFCCVATLVTPVPVYTRKASSAEKRAAPAPADGKRSAAAGEGATAPVLASPPLGNHGEISSPAHP